MKFFFCNLSELVLTGIIFQGADPIMLFSHLLLLLIKSEGYRLID
jgi:hypothetical protein